MVTSYQETTPPKIRPPVLDSLDESDQFAFVRRQGAMSWSDGPAEECDGMVLEQHRTEAVSGRVALDDERPGEVRKREHWRGREGGFESCERRLCRLGPCERVLEERRQRRCNGAILRDEFAVVSRESQESAERAHRTRARPVKYCPHLGAVHCHPAGRDDVAQICHRRCTE